MRNDKVNMEIKNIRLQSALSEPLQESCSWTRRKEGMVPTGFASLIFLEIADLSVYFTCLPKSCFLIVDLRQYFLFAIVLDIQSPFGAFGSTKPIYPAYFSVLLQLRSFRSTSFGMQRLSLASRCQVLLLITPILIR